MKFKKIFIVLLIFSSLLYAQKSNLILESEKHWQKRHLGDNALKAMLLYQSILKESGDSQIRLKYARSLHFYAAFQLKDDQKEEKIKLFSECISAADQVLQTAPGDLNALFLKGLCYSDRAKADRSLSDARKARELLESVIQKDFWFNQAIPLTILGKIYFEVPGWPIAFGSNKRALAYLRYAIAGNPKNRYNYLFLSEVLWDEGEKKEAKEVFEKGLALPAPVDFYAEDQRCLKRMEYQKKQFLGLD